MSGTDALDELLRRVAVHHLPGASGAAPAPAGRVIDTADALELVRRAEAAKLLGSLRDCVEDGDVHLPGAALDQLERRHEATMLWCLQLEVRLLELHEWFAAAGVIPHLVVKGPAVAHLDEADPSSRSFVDLDLLVRPDGIDRAVEVLEAFGGTRPWPPRRPGFDRRFAKGVTVTMSDGIEVDVHRMICDGVFGARIALDELVADPEPFRLGGVTMHALSRPHRFLHAAYHAVLGSPVPSLHSLRDIAGYLTAEGMDADEVVATARRWGGEAVLATAVADTLSTLPVAAPAWDDWLRAVHVDAAETAMIRRQRVEGSSIGRAKLDVVRELRGPGLKSAYVAAVLWPTPEHLRARGLTRTAMLRSLMPRR